MAGRKAPKIAQRFSAGNPVERKIAESRLGWQNTPLSRPMSIQMADAGKPVQPALLIEARAPIRRFRSLPKYPGENNSGNEASEKCDQGGSKNPGRQVPGALELT